MLCGAAPPAAKEDIARAVKEELQKSMSSFGFQVCVGGASAQQEGGAQQGGMRLDSRRAGTLLASSACTPATPPTTSHTQIINVLVTDIEPAAKVKAAMNEINAAQRLRLAAYEQSEADKVGEVVVWGWGCALRAGGG